MPEENNASITAILEALYEVLSIDPARAIAQARSLVASGLTEQEELSSVLAAVLIDGGGDLGLIDVVQEGVALCHDILTRNGDRLDVTYNLANGLSYLAGRANEYHAQSYLQSSPIRREARRLFEDVAQSDAPADLRAKARTNQANLLWYSYRWVEAYEAYRDAVALDPDNAVAASGAARLLLWAVKTGLGPPDILRGIGRRYVELARKSSSARPDLPPGLQDMIAALPPEAELIEWEPDLRSTDDYTRFVARNNLTLGLTLDGLVPSLRRWDYLMISSVSEDLHVRGDPAASGVPATFAAFNQLKADYLAARYTAYQAIEGVAPETGQYADTLDYAVYGISPSLLLLAQRASIDLLDKVAAAVTKYLIEFCKSNRKVT